MTVDDAFLDRMLAGSSGDLCTHDKADLQLPDKRNPPKRVWR